MQLNIYSNLADKNLKEHLYGNAKLQQKNTAYIQNGIETKKENK